MAQRTAKLDWDLTIAYQETEPSIVVLAGPNGAGGWTQRGWEEHGCSVSLA